jgi:hypothetical protein
MFIDNAMALSSLLEVPVLLAWETADVTIVVYKDDTV